MKQACALLLASTFFAASAAPAAERVAAYDASRYSQSVTDCDRRAAHSEDPNKVSPGISESKVDLPAAIAACRADLAKDAGNPRLQYQLGRVLAYDGQIDESLPLLQRSADLAYPQAQFVLGYLLLDGRLKAPVDPCRALELIRAAAVQKRMAAQVGLAAWDLDGHFGRCANRPRREELVQHLTAAARQDPKFYPELLIKDLMRQIEALGR